MKARNRIKPLLTLCCALLLVAAGVFGTLAYLTGTDTVNNTFTVGNVQITLDEAKVNTDGTPVAGAGRVQANAYHLLPGHTYTKDPIIHVDTNSENCYLFVKVEDQISAIEGVPTVANQMAAKGWKAVDGQANLYVYVGTGETPLAAAKGSNITVFEQIVIADSVSNTTLAGYADKAIVVTAYAVQTDGFEGKTASQIWAAAFNG